MFSHSLDNCAHKSQSDSSDVASYCMKKNSMCISHDDWQGEGVVCSHFKCYVGSRANTIWIAPPCVLDAGSALRGLYVKRKVDTKRSSTFQGKCFAENQFSCEHCRGSGAIQYELHRLAF